MKCSNLNRCNKPMLIFFDDIFICKTFDSIFKKGTKHIKDILIKCCNRQKILIKLIIYHSAIIV